MKTIALMLSAAIAASSAVCFASAGNDAFTVFEGLDNNKYYTVTIPVNKTTKDDAIVYANSKRAVIPQGSHTIYLRGVKPVNGIITADIIHGGKLTGTDDSAYTDDIGFTISEGEEYTLLQGGDITEANYIASLGGKYYDSSGAQKDPVAILAGSGANIARIRLSNNPGKGRGDGEYYLPDGFQDVRDCLNLAKRAKENGMAIEFTFNLSDYWSNAERQIIPHDWAVHIKAKLGYDVTDTAFLKTVTDDERAAITAELTSLVHDYVYDVMTQLAAQGTVPEYVSIGNEVNGGILFPFGASFDMQLSSKNLNAVWGDARTADDIPMPADTAALAAFMNAGYDAVKEVSPSSQVILHLANGAVYGSYTWALDIYNNAGAKYDILGASYYPAWSNNTVEGCVDFCGAVYEKYKKPIMIMETGFNWNAVRRDGGNGQLADIEAYKDKYPPSPEGQAAYLADLANGLRSLPDGVCIGYLYWDPLMIHVEDPEKPGASLSGWAVREADDVTEPDIVENSTLFDFDGKALPALEVFCGGDITDFIPEHENGPLYTMKNEDTSDRFIVNTADTPISFISVGTTYDDAGKLTGTATQRITLDPHGSIYLHNGIQTFLP